MVEITPRFAQQLTTLPTLWSRNRGDDFSPVPARPKRST